EVVNICGLYLADFHVDKPSADLWRAFDKCQILRGKHNNIQIANIVAQTLLCLPLRIRSEEHTSELQSRFDLVCRLLLGKKNWFFTWFLRFLRWLCAFYLC